MYIKKLTDQGLAPTREMIRNFGSRIAQKPVLESWVTRFIHENDIHLITRWSAPLDRTRYNADNGLKYKQYFDALFTKIIEYDIEPRLIYNMDEKGFMIGVGRRMKRVFSKASYTARKNKTFTQDGNRDWITILATVCADGTWIPPSILYAAESGNIRDT